MSAGTAQEGNPQMVRVLFADHLNLARGKFVAAEMVDRGGPNYTRVAQSLFGVTMDRRLIPAAHARVLEGIGDMQIRYDGRELRDGWLPNCQTVVADLLGTDGEPLPLDGRAALKRAIADWEALGYRPQLGIELEANIFQRDPDGKWVPYDCPGAYVYGTGPTVDPAGIMERIFGAATDFGLQVETLTTEYDQCQLELTLRYGDALSAVDAIFLFKLLAREVAAQQGYYLSFMPKPHNDLGGSGLHLNLSFLDGDGKNAIGGDRKHGISELAEHCTAGLVRHHKALGALLAPTVNSYKRLQPASMCGYWANWALDHRGVAVRVSRDRGAKARIEHRLGDCSSNPYTAAAAVLQACRLGYQQQYPLPPEETGDCLESQDTEESVCGSLGESLDALQQDTALTQALGQELVENFLDIKRDEVEHTGKMSEPEVIDHYFPYI